MAIEISLIYLVTESCSGTWFSFLFDSYFLFIYFVLNIY